MAGEPIRHIAVWPKVLRICHWSLASATLVLLLTGWLATWAPERAESVDEIHFVAAAVLLAALAVRIGLLTAGKGVASWRVLKPTRHLLSQGLQVLRSYVTLGKLPLPRWHAHNPLWALLYPLLFLALLLQVATGLLLLNDITLLGALSLRSLHHWGWEFLLLFSTLHIAAVFFHDAQSSTAEISGMVNGYRCVTLAPLDLGGESDGTKVVPLDALARELKKSGGKPDSD